MPEEKAVTYHYRVLRRPRVVAFSHANLRSLADPSEGPGRSERGGRGQQPREKAKTTYESNNARQLVTSEVGKNATRCSFSSLVQSFLPRCAFPSLARSASSRMVDVNTFHFSRATRLIFNEIREDEEIEVRDVRRGKKGRRWERERWEKRKRSRRGERGREREKVEEDGDNS